MIKHALLNQLVIAGMGNIYADESLFKAKIHPKKKLERLKDDRLRELCGIIRKVLGHSIAAGGTTFRDYMNAEGKRGKFSKRLNVYGKKGKPCPNCGTPIKKIVVASRGTHYCPKCQRM
jgi:formamidopyrimidine-DNA glycosylase